MAGAVAFTSLHDNQLLIAVPLHVPQIECQATHSLVAVSAI